MILVHLRSSNPSHSRALLNYVVDLHPNKGRPSNTPFLSIFPLSTKMFLIWSLLVTAALASAGDLFGTWTTKSRDVLTGPVCGTMYTI